VNDELVSLEKIGAKAAKNLRHLVWPGDQKRRSRVLSPLKQNSMLSALFSRSAAKAADFSHLQQASVQFRQAVKSYGDHRVLNGIDLTIHSGEVVAILGPSGSGKIHVDSPD
jgi:amino acid ABC transporter ATP-binding protein, PAAT family (TC 3.A.1.3.-)